VATKKEKREALQLKREKWLAERRESGLQAQRKDKEHRKNKKRDEQRDQHNKEHSWKVLDKNCLLCQDRLAEARRDAKRQEALEEVADG